MGTKIGDSGCKHGTNRNLALVAAIPEACPPGKGMFVVGRWCSC
jgi:hypothetical protein